MDEPDLSWPAWKFGMKRDDLFTKLHDQYNTVSSSIQDHEAFHHDVFEISHEASTADEFHRLLSDRREQRLRELNDSLELASVEIIANPALIGTAQWQHAVQLFRTRSLDSLVRYFASYLPGDHAWHRSGDSTLSSDVDSAESLANSHHSLFFGGHENVATHESQPLRPSMSNHLPPSPRSMTMNSDSSATSPIESSHHDYMFNNLTPARTLSFSESESEALCLRDSCLLLRDDDESSHSEPETPSTSISDLSEADQALKHHDLLIVESHDVPIAGVEAPCADRVHTPFYLTTDPTESETPTPKPEGPATAFFDARPSPIRTSPALPHRRSLSPRRRHLYEPRAHACRRSPRSQRHAQSRDPSPEQVRRRRRRGLLETPEDGLMQTTSPDSSRSRLRCRRRATDK